MEELEIEKYRALEKKFYKDKTLNDGDVVLYETMYNKWKKTTIKKTLNGKLFLEAAETGGKNPELVIVEAKEFEREDIIYVPGYEELAASLNKEIPKYSELLEEAWQV